MKEETAPRMRNLLWDALIVLLGFVACYLFSSIGFQSRQVALPRFAAFLQFAGLINIVFSIYYARKELALPSLFREFARDFWTAADESAGIFTRRPERLDDEYRQAMRDEGVPTERRVRDLERDVDTLIDLNRHRVSMMFAMRNAAWAASMPFGSTPHRIRIEIIGLLWLGAGVLLPAFPSAAFLLWPPA